MTFQKTYPASQRYIHFSLGACCGAGSTHPAQFAVPGWEMVGNQRILTQTCVPPLIHLNTWKASILSVLIPLSKPNPFRVMKSGISLFWRGKRPFVAHTGNSGLQTRTKNPLEIVAFTSKTWTSKRLCKPHFRPTILGPSSFWRQPRYFQYSQQHLQGCSIEVILRSIQLFGQETVTSLGLVMGFSHTSYQPEK